MVTKAAQWRGPRSPLNGETLAALGAARIDNLAATHGLHPHAETMGAFAARNGRLIGTFHLALTRKLKQAHRPYRPSMPCGVLESCLHCTAWLKHSCFKAGAAGAFALRFFALHQRWRLGLDDWPLTALTAGRLLARRFGENPLLDRVCRALSNFLNQRATGMAGELAQGIGLRAVDNFPGTGPLAVELRRTSRFTAHLRREPPPTLFLRAPMAPRGHSGRSRRAVFRTGHTRRNRHSISDVSDSTLDE